MNSSTTHQLPAGTLLNGKYQIECALGEGGFGITYKGRDKLLDMPVAIKEFFPTGYANRYSPASTMVTLNGSEGSEYFSHWKEKFLSEARILAKFSDVRSIVNVRDFFEENGTAYIVMEFLGGSTLKKYVTENGAVPPKRMISMIIPLINALSLIHKQGLIHRDISPDNIMLMPDGTLKLYDFGSARDFSMQGQQSLSIMLKHGYSPQEQYRSKGKQGPWTDVYSLCATVYFCITGTVPDESMERVFEDEVKLPSQLGIAISPYLESVIMKGMSVREEDRYQTMDELLDAVARKDGGVSVINGRLPDSAGSRKAEKAPEEVSSATIAVPKTDAPSASKTAVIVTAKPPKIPAPTAKPHENTPVSAQISTPASAGKTVSAPRKKDKWIPAAVISALAVCAALVFFMNFPGKVTVAGTSVLRNTTELIIDSQTITDENIQSLSDLRQLKSLTIQNSDLTGISSSLALTGCRNIESVTFTHCGGNMDLFLNCLPNKAGIKSLSFISTGSYSVEYYQIDLSKFPNLEHLEITLSAIGLKKTSLAPKLRSLVLNNSGGFVDGFSCLSYIKSLESLSIINIDIGDISFICDLPNLKTVDFSNSIIIDPSPLYDCENITSVNLDNTWIRNGWKARS